MSNVLILDAYNLMHRARFSFNSGQYNIVYSFFRTLKPIIEKHEPDQVFFVLEGYPRRNQELLKGEYKANRILDESDPKFKALQEFNRQKKVIIQLIKDYFGFVTVKHQNMECDDTINNIIYHLTSEEKDEVTVVSSDTDFIQLLQEFSHVKLWNPIKKNFIEPPEYDYVIWKSLRGDKTDNIPGLPKVGDKTAEKLVVENRYREYVEAKGLVDEFERNVELVRLETMPPQDFLDAKLLSWTAGKNDMESLRNDFQRFEFNSILKEKAWSKFVSAFEGLEGLQLFEYDV